MSAVNYVVLLVLSCLAGELISLSCFYCASVILCSVFILYLNILFLVMLWYFTL